MLSPIVYLKVVCARNSYLKEKRPEMKSEKCQRLVDIVGDRFHIYQKNGWKTDAKRILEIGTTKKHATDGEKNCLRKIKNALGEKALLEGLMG